jgi:hypothetical protein
MARKEPEKPQHLNVLMDETTRDTIALLAKKYRWSRPDLVALAVRWLAELMAFHERVAAEALKGEPGGVAEHYRRVARQLPIDLAAIEPSSTVNVGWMTPKRDDPTVRIWDDKRKTQWFITTDPETKELAITDKNGQPGRIVGGAIEEAPPTSPAKAVLRPVPSLKRRKRQSVGAKS